MKAPNDLFKCMEQWNEHFARLYDNAAVRNITFIVTEECNLRCTYCYEKHKNNEHIMNWETAKRAVDFVLGDNYHNYYNEFGKARGVILEFIGGEPLLEIDLIRKIVAYFKIRSIELNHPWALNYMISIATNGLLYCDDNVQNFLRQNNGRVSIGISIDGHKELHDRCRKDSNGNGSYDRVVKSVELWTKQYFAPSTKVTFSTESLKDIATAVIHLFSMGIRDVNANVVFEDVWKEGDDIIFYEQLIELADRIIDGEYYLAHACSLFDKQIGQPLDLSFNDNWCGGNGGMLAIGTDGKLYPCLRYAEFALHNKKRSPMIVGDIWNGFDEKNKLLDELICITRRSQSSDECFNCKVASQCAWCTAFNYDYFGTPNKRATFICKMHKARVLANHYFWNKLYSKLSYEDVFTLNLSHKDTVQIISTSKEVDYSA